jgi:hypothetical protein
MDPERRERILIGALGIVLGCLLLFILAAPVANCPNLQSEADEIDAALKGAGDPPDLRRQIAQVSRNSHRCHLCRGSGRVSLLSKWTGLRFLRG